MPIVDSVLGCSWVIYGAMCVDLGVSTLLTSNQRHLDVWLRSGDPGEPGGYHCRAPGERGGGRQGWRHQGKPWSMALGAGHVEMGHGMVMGQRSNAT